MGSAGVITLSFELFFVRKQAEPEREWLPHLSRSDRKAMGCAINIVIALLHGMGKQSAKASTTNLLVARAECFRLREAKER